MGKRWTLFLVIALIALMCFATVWGATKGFTRDSKLNEAIQTVINGDANEGIIHTLEAAFKKDPKNADLAGILAGAYGIVADKMNKPDLAQKANSLAANAVRLNPNSIPAKMGHLGSEIYSKNRINRDKAISELEHFSKAHPDTGRISKFLIGKGHALNGNRGKAIENFQASNIPLAHDHLTHIDKIIPAGAARKVQEKTTPAQAPIRR